MKKLLKLITSRAFIVSFILFLELLLVVVIIFLVGSLWYFQVLFAVIRIIAVLYIINTKGNPAYKVAWLLPIAIAPMVGAIFYMMLGGNKPSKHKKKKIDRIDWQMKQNLPGPKEYMPIIEQMKKESPECAGQSLYISREAFCPPFKNTYTEYLPIGEAVFQKLKNELQAAKHYIFLEYFILEEGTMWNTILDILKEKAKNGVDVRVIYDDFGCINKKLPRHYDQYLSRFNIKAIAFNPFRPIIAPSMNNRDHRKIAVIDGHTGFTGGINLADEYININSKFGHWKDTSIMLKGEGVWSFTVMFLSMWGYLKGRDDNYVEYRPYAYQDRIYNSDAIVQPYNDMPWDDKPTGENVYLNIINKAKRYIYITTPYLIISNEVATALQNAADCGVDVRIITPHIPDKKYIFELTRANYEQLVEHGVKIYEYKPGFIHAKMFISDDICGTLGTINLDYRSLYLHFECGVWMYKTPALIDMRDDFLATQEKCIEITEDYCKSTPVIRRFFRYILQAFAPLL